jgi:succinate-semialdehyde dehydrogenase/glutarate-semialdehyde dehydrogenase
MAILSVNPATGEELARFQEHSWAEVEERLARAESARAAWAGLSFDSRASLMTAAAERLRAERSRLAELATREMGKPIVEAEIEKCAWTAEWLAENGERFLRPVETPSNASRSLVRFPPLGLVLAVMPWNFPLWQVFRAAIPALLAGNVMVLKHASNVPQCALAAERIFREAGFPEGVFQTLLVGSDVVPRLIADPRVAGVTVTGSVAAGSKIGEAAGREIKKVVLELGGSDPFVVLEDADLEAAAAVACRARNQNNGQSCIAAKRFIVVDSVADEFEQRFTSAVGALRVGNPLERSTQVGPLARPDLVDDLDRQLRASLDLGARLLFGGRRGLGPGNYFQPTVVSGVTAEMPVFREETFGPLAALIRVAGEDEAVAVANDTEFGLGSNVWTGDPERGVRLAERIQAGMVYVNGMVASDARLPFGGIKRSGIGRELSEFGIREFVNIQTVWVGPAR